MIALPSLYRTTGGHLNHDRWMSKTTSRLLVCLWCVHVGGCQILLYFLLSHRRWVPLFFQFTRNACMSVLSSNDCLTFPLSDHWGTLGTWQEVSVTTSQLLEWLWCVHVGGCHNLLHFLSPNSEGESHCSFHFSQWCMQCHCTLLMTALLFLYLTTGEHLEHDRKWVRLSHDSLNDCGVCMWVVVTFYCIFFLPTQRVSPTVLFISPNNAYVNAQF